MSLHFEGRALARLCTAALLVSALGCGSGKTGGPVAGAVDEHCTAPDGGAIVQAVDPAMCRAMADGGMASSDYGATMFNAEGDDDDCKYHLSWSSTPIQQDQDVTFTVQATEKASGKFATGADVVAEVFLNDTHPAPNSNQKTTEGEDGTYTIGPVRFDAAGQWTVRFHLHQSCVDEDPASPHGHAAFYVEVP